MRRLGLMLILIAAFAPSALAQSSEALFPQSSLTVPLISAKSAQDDPVAKALEQAVNRLAVAEEKNRLLEARLEAKDSTIAAKDGLIAIRDEQLKLALEANKDRAGANTIDQFRVESCQQQLLKADSEINRLRHPGLFASIFDARTLTGAMVGFGIGRLNR